MIERTLEETEQSDIAAHNAVIAVTEMYACLLKRERGRRAAGSAQMGAQIALLSKQLIRIRDAIEAISADDDALTIKAKLKAVLES